MWNLKQNDKNDLTEQKETDSENKIMVVEREREVGRDKLGVWD